MSAGAASPNWRAVGVFFVGTSLASPQRVALPSARYEPRRPAEDVLYTIVQAHFETFRTQAASLRDGEGLPRFVEGEFRDFLRCGSLAGGFARFRCAACGLDRLIAFSCKRRGFCQSCGGRRTLTPTRKVRALGAPGWPSAPRTADGVRCAYPPEQRVIGD